LRSFDLREFNQLSGYYGQLNDADKERLKEQIQLERSKIVQEHAINELAERCERRQVDFRRVLDQAQQACFAQDRDAVLSQVSVAISTEGQQKNELRSLQNVEQRLLDLTRVKLKKE
jgi:hypothetical protein